MRSDRDLVAGLSAGFILGVMLGIWLGAAPTDAKYKQQAIEHGYAEYHPQTGKWGWKEKP